MTIDFTEQVAIVTGAGKGLGRAYALELARRNATVVINDIPGSEDALELVKEIRAMGGTCFASLHSVASKEGALGLYSEVMDKTGRIDILINNAGILRTGDFVDIPGSEFEQHADVHMFGVFYLTQAVFKVMKAAGYGRIVNTSSAGVFGFPTMASYATAKGSIIGLTTTLSHEGEPHNIKVNALFPNANTDMTKNAMDDTAALGEDPEWLASIEAVMPRFEAAGVAPLAVLLASKECPASGEMYSAVAGRYARVFLGVTQGWIAPNGEMEAENILENIDTVRSTDSFIVPAITFDEFSDAATRIAAAGLGNS